MNPSFRLKTNSTRTSFVLQEATYPNIQKQPKPKDKYKQKQTRHTSIVGSDSYNRSLRRAFARAKLLAFFNTDLTQFITFTYADNMLDENKALKDLKLFLQTEKRKYSQKKTAQKFENNQNTDKTTETELSTFPRPNNNNKLTDVINRKKIRKTRSNRGGGNVENSDNLSITNAELQSIFEARKGNKANPFKYIYVFERQKRGAIHVHMVCNDIFEYRINKNGYKELVNWPHGFSSVLTIDNFDNDFKPYLYLFKYMEKSQRIGKSFIHTSRKSFDNIDWVDYDYYIDELKRENIVYEEDYELKLDQKNYTINKKYFRKTN